MTGSERLRIDTQGTALARSHRAERDDMPAINAGILTMTHW